MTNQEILSRNPEFRYMLLSRMKSDCEFFLNHGARSTKCLWAGNVEEQISIMIDLYNSFESKPAWTSIEEIYEFKNLMKD
ncbi:MAG: LPD11 domain-containing protein [Clostridia bacterium]